MIELGTTHDFHNATDVAGEANEQVLALRVVHPEYEGAYVRADGWEGGNIGAPDAVLARRPVIEGHIFVPHSDTWGEVFRVELPELVGLTSRQIGAQVLGAELYHALETHSEPQG